MKLIEAPTIPNNRTKGMVHLVISILCMIYSRLPVEALEQTPGSANQAQTSIIVYLHPVATDVEIMVDDLLTFNTGSVFGVWCYQANLTSFLEAKPRTVHIKTRLKDRESSYCDIEVRKITAGDIAKTLILVEKTIRVADMEALNKKPTEYLTALTIDIALSESTIRPLWDETDGVDLKPVIRDTSIGLVQEIYSAMQKCDFHSMMKLIDPALTNQAIMEVIPPEIFKQAMRNKLMR